MVLFPLKLLGECESRAFDFKSKKERKMQRQLRQMQRQIVSQRSDRNVVKMNHDNNAGNLMRNVMSSNKEFGSQARENAS